MVDFFGKINNCTKPITFQSCNTCLRLYLCKQKQVIQDLMPGWNRNKKSASNYIPREHDLLKHLCLLLGRYKKALIFRLNSFAVTQMDMDNTNSPVEVSHADLPDSLSISHWPI